MDIFGDLHTEIDIKDDPTEEYVLESTRDRYSDEQEVLSGNSQDSNLNVPPVLMYCGNSDQILIPVKNENQTNINILPFESDFLGAQISIPETIGWDSFNVLPDYLIETLKNEIPEIGEVQTNILHENVISVHKKSSNVHNLSINNANKPKATLRHNLKNVAFQPEKRHTKTVSDQNTIVLDTCVPQNINDGIKNSNSDIILSNSGFAKAPSKKPTRFNSSALEREMALKQLQQMKNQSCSLPKLRPEDPKSLRQHGKKCKKPIENKAPTSSVRTYRNKNKSGCEQEISKTSVKQIKVLALSQAAQPCKQIKTKESKSPSTQDKINVPTFESSESRKLSVSNVSSETVELGECSDNPCPSCGEYYLKGQFEKHKEIRHIFYPENVRLQRDIVKKKLCHICGVFIGITSFFYHLSGHEEKKFRCEICLKYFSTEQLLKQHTFNTHNRERIVQCKLCPKKFKGHINSHIMKVHSKEWSYHCKECNEIFKSESEIEQHITQHFPNKKLKNFKKLMERKSPYFCEMCNKYYSCKHTMKMHLKNLHSHERILLEEKRKVVCDFCGITYQFKSTMKCHLAKHLGVREHVCKKCGRSYDTVCAFKRHKLKCRKK